MTALLAPRTQGDIGAALDAMSVYGSENDGTFANHAPMALTALAGIGGDATQLRRFFDYYRDYKMLTPFGAAQTPLTAADWDSALGRREREPDLRAFFTREVAANGVEATVRAYLPRLAPGVAASAFHGLMRLAYALLRDSAHEAAIALGYWAATYLELRPATGAAPVTDDPGQVLVRAMAIAPLHDLKLHELLWRNMRDAAALPEFAPVVDWLEIDDATRGKMAATGLALFAATQHFAALHIVTGLHWLRIVEPYLDRATFFSLLRHFWQGVAALVGELGFPALPDAATLARWRTLPAPDWADLHAAAAQSFDEHDISLAFSAFEENKVYADPLYRIALARRLATIPDFC